ncbi:MAG: hypothetical protein PQJ50_09370 [Spirochaetales bacterium]|nr:hypothetical protein [Spirochaetales bacterium]
MTRPVPFSPKNGVPGSMAGIELPVYSLSILKEVKFYITDHGTPATPYSLAIYRFSSEAGPETPIRNLEITCTATEGNKWISHSLESDRITLEPGNYLVAMKWMASPGEDGLTAQTIGFKESDDEPVSWMNWNGRDDGWSKDTGPYRGNFMIEAALEKV